LSAAELGRAAITFPTFRSAQSIVTPFVQECALPSVWAIAKDMAEMRAHDAQRTSVRHISHERSSCSLTAPLSTGAQKR
jgi:hypothetical protein